MEVVAHNLLRLRGIGGNNGTCSSSHAAAHHEFLSKKDRPPSLLDDAGCKALIVHCSATNHEMGIALLRQRKPHRGKVESSSEILGRGFREIDNNPLAILTEVDRPRCFAKGAKNVGLAVCPSDGSDGHNRFQLLAVRL